ncbi:MAG: choice-of-anchor L domain-containing protein [Candidatus Latescibacterota bacterium]
MKKKLTFGSVLILSIAIVLVIGCLRETPQEPQFNSPVMLMSEGTTTMLRPVPGLDGKIVPNVEKSPAAGLAVSDLSSGTTPADLVAALLGSGPNAPIVSNITYTGANPSAGLFSGGTGIIGFESGVVLGSGDSKLITGPNTIDNATLDTGLPGDADLDGLIPGYSTNDATVLEFDFECPVLQYISFQYVFTSEEYNEWVFSDYNDVFGFFVNGVNIALLPDGVTPVSVNNVNCNDPYNPPTGSNCSYYINNDLDDGGGAINTEMDGMTVVLTAQTAVNPGINHIKLAIADAGDHVLDSNVLIKGESFVCAPQAQPYFDFHPTSCPNPLNIKSQGKSPAAILGSDNFDVNDVDVSTVLLNGVSPWKYGYADVSTPVIDGMDCECTTAGPDGYKDLTLKFITQDIVATLGPVTQHELVVITLTGFLLDGTPFAMTDCIKIVGANAPHMLIE